MSAAPPRSTRSPSSDRRATSRLVVAGATALLVAPLAFVGAAADGAPEAGPTDYVGSVEVIHDEEPAEVAQGVVFEDANRNSRLDEDEEGIAEVPVSNGREVVLTDDEGHYELPARNDMTVFVTKPADWITPVDEDNIPQFFYHHLPEGSPDLRFAGLAPTGPLPETINFPLAEAEEPAEVDCAIVGDTQTYSNRA